MTVSDKLMERYGKPHLSYSSIKKALGDIQEFDMYMKGELKYTSDALRFGNLYDDMLFCTEEEFNERYACIDEDAILAQLSTDALSKKNPRMTSEYKKILEEMSNSVSGQIVSTDDLNKAKAMINRLDRSGVRQQYLSGDFQVEFNTEIPDSDGNPVLVKGFLDCLGDGFITDSKTTVSISKFRYSVRDYGYDIQAYIYTEVFDMEDFYWVAQEKKEPYLPAVIKCSESSLFAGQMKFFDAVEKINKFLDDEDGTSEKYYEIFEI